MEGRLIKLAKPLLGSHAKKFEEKAYLYVNYMEVSQQPAYRDYIYFIKQLRDGARNSLELGIVDKFGKNHDDELRACIAMLNSILAYPENIKASYERDATRMQGQAQAIVNPVGMWGLTA